MDAEIVALQKELKSLESNLAEQRSEKSKELTRIKKEMDEEMKKELEQKEEGHRDLMKEKEEEQEQLQEDAKTATENLEKAKTDGKDRLEQQAEEERVLREETVDNLRGELKKKEEDWIKRLENKDARRKEEEENLKAIMTADDQHQKDQHEIAKKNLEYEHETENEYKERDVVHVSYTKHYKGRCTKRRQYGHEGANCPGKNNKPKTSFNATTLFMHVAL